LWLAIGGLVHVRRYLPGGPGFKVDRPGRRNLS
jgi:hypothetical protein